MADNENVTHILWTGGWDSTYRVLVLMHEGKTVQPHYLIDRNRASSSHELVAMEAIREGIRENASRLPGNLLPTIISERATSVQDEAVQKAYHEIIRESYIGEQYMWLADYCKGKAISRMEIGVENNPIVLSAVKASGYPYSEIFGRFEFPIISVEKLQMKVWAAKAGLLPVMEKSWFCHRPAQSGQPCGVCHPCEVTVKGGMGYRLPVRSRVRYHFRVIPRVKAVLKKLPRLYYLLYSLKHNK